MAHNSDSRMSSQNTEREEPTIPEATPPTSAESSEETLAPISRHISELLGFMQAYMAKMDSRIDEMQKTPRLIKRNWTKQDCAY